MDQGPGVSWLIQSLHLRYDAVGLAAYAMACLETTAALFFSGATAPSSSSSGRAGQFRAQEQKAPARGISASMVRWRVGGSWTFVTPARQLTRAKQEVLYRTHGY